MKANELIAEAVSLPVKERVLLVDRLLSSLNTSVSSFDKNWVALAKDRLQQLKAVEVKGIPSEEVFKKIAARFQ